MLAPVQAHILLMKPECSPENMALPKPKHVYSKPQILLISTKVTCASKVMVNTNEFMFLGLNWGRS